MDIKLQVADFITLLERGYYNGIFLNSEQADIAEALLKETNNMNICLTDSLGGHYLYKVY